MLRELAHERTVRLRRRVAADPAVAVMLRHQPGELDRLAVATYGAPRELGPLLGHRAVVDLRNRAGGVHAPGDVVGLPELPDPADTAVERAVVVEQERRVDRTETAEEIIG